MAERPHRYEMKCDNDPRLIAGIGGAVEHMALVVGFSDEESGRLRQAAEQVSRLAFDAARAHQDRITAILELHDDSIQLHLRHHGDALPAETLKQMHADRVSSKTENGIQHTSMVKQLPEGTG